MLISAADVVQQVPGWQEGDPQEETESPAQVCYEGDGGVGPDLPLHPHVGRGEAVEDGEVAGQEFNWNITSPLICPNSPVSMVSFMNGWSRSSQGLTGQFVFLGKIKETI